MALLQVDIAIGDLACVASVGVGCGRTRPRGGHRGLDAGHFRGRLENQITMDVNNLTVDAGGDIFRRKRVLSRPNMPTGNFVKRIINAGRGDGKKDFGGGVNFTFLSVVEPKNVSAAV